MVRHVFQVPEVSCHHCIEAIAGELGTIPGIRSVDVDLDRKLVTVTADESVPDERIRAAIEQAGYEVVG